MERMHYLKRVISLTVAVCFSLSSVLGTNTFDLYAQTTVNVSESLRIPEEIGKVCEKGGSAYRL